MIRITGVEVKGLHTVLGNLMVAGGQAAPT